MTGRLWVLLFPAEGLPTSASLLSLPRPLSGGILKGRRAGDKRRQRRTSKEVRGEGRVRGGDLGRPGNEALHWLIQDSFYNTPNLFPESPQTIPPFIWTVHFSLQKRTIHQPAAPGTQAKEHGPMGRPYAH